MKRIAKEQDVLRDYILSVLRQHEKKCRSLSDSSYTRSTTRENSPTSGRHWHARCAATPTTLLIVPNWRISPEILKL